MTPATTNLGFLLSKAAEPCNARHTERFTAAGFPEMRPSYVAVLLPLFEHDRLRMTELAQRAALSKQRLSVLVPRCERDGLVHQERDQDDRRAFRVALTQRPETASSTSSAPSPSASSMGT